MNTTTMTNDTTKNLLESAAEGHTETFMEKLDKRIADFEKNYEFEDSWPIYKLPGKECSFHLLPRREQYIVELLARGSSN